MSDAERVAQLEELLARFLQPVRDIPFPVVIKAICGTTVLPVSVENLDDRALVEGLAQAARIAGRMVQAAPIRRNRPNEVGNDLEPFVIAGVREVGMDAERPRSRKGRGQQTGYPDALVYDQAGRATYLEVKSFAEGAAVTTMRSFYLSPSADPKVCLDARHLVLGFGVEAEAIDGSRDSLYRAVSFKLIDLHGLNCDVKYEFNSDNRRMYADHLVLAQGRI